MCRFISDACICKQHDVHFKITPQIYIRIPTIWRVNAWQKITDVKICTNKMFSRDVRTCRYAVTIVKLKIWQKSNTDCKTSITCLAEHISASISNSLVLTETCCRWTCIMMQLHVYVSIWNQSQELFRTWNYCENGANPSFVMKIVIFHRVESILDIVLHTRAKKIKRILPTRKKSKLLLPMQKM